MKPRQSAEAAQAAIARVNRLAARIERFKEELYDAEQRLKRAQTAAWNALPEDAMIRMGDTWSYVAPELDGSAR